MTDQPRSFVCCHTSRKLRGKIAKVKNKRNCRARQKKGLKKEKEKGQRKRDETAEHNM
jgi:hypothetical protein